LQEGRGENETNARTSSSSPEPNAQRDLNAHNNATVVVIVDGAIKLDFSLAADYSVVRISVLPSSSSTDPRKASLLTSVCTAVLNRTGTRADMTSSQLSVASRFLFDYHCQWLKCNGTHGNAVPPPPICGSKRSPTSDCYNASERHTTIVRGPNLNVASPTSNFAL